MIFDFNGHEIETVVIKDENGKDLPLFRGQQVAELLEFKNPSNAVANHCDKISKLSYLDIAKQSVSALPLKSGAFKNNNLQEEKPLFTQLVESGWKHNELVAKRSWIPESDLYKLVMHSTKENAKEFQNWVVETVLPTIALQRGIPTSSKTAIQTSVNTFPTQLY